MSKGSGVDGFVSFVAKPFAGNNLLMIQDIIGERYESKRKK